MTDHAYIDEQIDVVNRNFKYRDLYWNDPRFVVMRAYYKNARIPRGKILSIGCGSYEPILLNTSHALDIAPNARYYLKELGWNGCFVPGDCTNLPFLDHEFDVAFCSEVIEHLPTLEDVKRTISETNRVANFWMITTPCNPIGPQNTEPTHKRSFTRAEIEDLFKGIDVDIVQDKLYYYVSKKAA